MSASSLAPFDRLCATSAHRHQNVLYVCPAIDHILLLLFPCFCFCFFFFFFLFFLFFLSLLRSRWLTLPKSREQNGGVVRSTPGTETRWKRNKQIAYMYRSIQSSAAVIARRRFAGGNGRSSLHLAGASRLSTMHICALARNNRDRKATKEHCCEPPARDSGSGAHGSTSMCSGTLQGRRVQHVILIAWAASVSHSQGNDAA